MKTKITRVLTAVAATASTVAAFDLTLAVKFLPQNWGGYILAGSAITLAVKEISVVVGDILDDGRRNGSFK